MALQSDPVFEVRKHPYAERTYGIDYAAKSFLETGETITSSTWEIVPSGAGHLQYSSPAQSTTATGAMFTEGKLDVDYRVTNKIITTKGKDARSFTVKVRAR